MGVRLFIYPKKYVAAREMKGSSSGGFSCFAVYYNMDIINK